MSGSYDDDGEEDSSLQITPSFKKGKGKGGSRSKGRGGPAAAAASDEIRGQDKEAGYGENDGDNDDDDEDAANSSAVLFKRSSKKKGIVGLGAASATRKSTGTPRSKLNVSFGQGQDGGEGAHDDGDNASASAVRKGEPTRKLQRPSGLATSSSFVGAADGNLSQSMSLASLSQPSYSKDYIAELKAATTAGPSTSAATGPASRYDDLTLSKFGSAAVQSMSDDTALLPNEAAIASAKARRETARRLGVDPAAASASRSSDYISLDVGMPTSSRESRLVREEDEIGEGEEAYDEFTGASERIPLGKKGKSELEKRRKEELRGLIEGEEGMDLVDGGDGLEPEEDEEEREWQMAQIKRGEQRSSNRSGRAEERTPYRSAPIPDSVPLPSLPSVSARLQATLAEARSSKAENDELLSAAEREASALTAQEAELRSEVERVTAKYEWFTEFKDWIEDVAQFLDAKFPELEKVERDNAGVQRERAQLVSRRRMEDDSDDVAAFTGAEIPLGPKGREDEGMEVDENEPAAEVDDFGRAKRESDVAPRSYARQTRRQDRKKRRVTGMVPSDGEDGYATDDALLPSDAQDLAAAQEAMAADLAGLFSDVQSDEFTDPSLGVRPRFEEWKHRYGEEYGNAFGGLAMVGVWEFWARCELATWNPFAIPELHTRPSSSLDSYTWHQALTAFQHAREQSLGPDGQPAHLDPEDDALNGMMNTVVVPRLRQLAVEGYDPYSARATSAALQVVEEISYCLDTGSARFEHLLLGFLSRYQLAILHLQSLVQPYLREIRSPRIGMDVESIQARNRFVQRCLKLLSSALRWRSLAKEVLLPAGGEGEGVGAGLKWVAALSMELVERTMLPVLEAGWETGGSEVAAKVVSLFPANSLSAEIVQRLGR